MRTIIPTTLVVLGLITAARAAPGQRLPEVVRPAGLSLVAESVADTIRYRENPGMAGLGAVIGGGVGFLAGALAGAALVSGSSCGDDLCALGAAVTGAIVGESVGVGLGAHLGNGRRGNVLASIGASAAVLIPALLLNKHGNAPQNAIVLVPILQISAAVIVETAIGRSRARGRAR